MNTRKCVNVNIGFGRSVALCEHSPHYGARLPRQRFITSASVPSSPLRRPLFLPSQRVHSPSFNHTHPLFLRYLVNLLHLLSSAAMHDSPSSPRRSIAPAPPKQQQTKKAGAPKAKGAVRAKSGCYTCRIRRKVGHLPPLPRYIHIPTSHRVPLPLEMRRTAKWGGPLRDVYPSPPPMPWLWPEAPRMAQGMCIRALRVVARCPFPSDLTLFPTLFHRRTIMSPCSVRRSRTSWPRRG